MNLHLVNIDKINDVFSFRIILMDILILVVRIEDIGPTSSSS
ncbi:hypothetical protein HME9304_00603 [Flagellimonas maritima]|uniref:Uncharacterized protein n=1 Tax=Flagellimonas maritima TaxID=1383885 RepID=A0A2Z4LPA5_9FLAO|nr:hypothetical protein HME9304_00603 [Allomuricauda aurantiaca]